MASNSCRSEAADIGNAGFDDIRGKGSVPDKTINSSAIQPKLRFILEAKLGPNEWRSVCDVYPHAEISHCYDDQDDAKRAKSSLKALLLGPWKGRFNKKPIRIREISQNDLP